MRTRTAVSLTENPSTPDPTLLWYSRAIGVLRTKRKFVDPTSWRFLGAVHDYDASVDPYASSSDPPPPKSVQKTYWKACQHASWFFLPWHRMYLYYFERIIAAAVVEAGGPADWTLPYWDYGQGAKSRKLPWSFRKKTWPSGETNYLYVDRRADGMNAGTASLSEADVESATALDMKLFSTSPTSSDVEFGGPRVKNHEGGGPTPFGGVESSPHNNVHVAVGGGGPQGPGFMTDPRTAALDPIFWLHHANIDRLWEVWISQGARQNPTQKSWLDKSFPFHDAAGKPAKLTCAQVVDTKALDYVYDHATRAAPVVRVPDGLFKPSTRRLEMIGATSKAFSVGAPNTVAFKMARPAGVAKEARAVAHKRVLLHLEALQSGERPGAYDVFVNSPDDKAAGDGSAHFAGRISLFGPHGKVQKDDAHARSGFNFVLDITALHEAQLGAGAWDPAKLRVTLKPVYDWSDPVKVGRISVNVL